MDNKSKTKILPRKLLSAAMAGVFMISLSACSNNDNELFEDSVYAESGDYQILKSELWDELKWNAHLEIISQIENVVLNEQIEKITLVMKNNYDGLTESEKGIFADKDEYSSLYNTYKERLAIYAFQDVFNLSYKIDLSFDEIESFSDSQIKIAQEQYVDEIFASYGIEKINNLTIADLVDVTDENKEENFFTLANGLPQLYYPILAKELLAREALLEDIVEEEGDTPEYNAEDEKIGYFTTSAYISKFEELYGNQYDLNAIVIRFTSSTEYTDTLRAFGLKVNNKKLYYISGEGKTYSEYIKYYDDFNFSTQEEEAWNLTENSPKAILEIYLQMYNYIYGGYKTKLTSNLTGLTEATQLNNLRTITGEIVDAYVSDPETKYEATVNSLLTNNSESVTFTRESLDEIGSSFTTYMYDTLSLKDTEKPYSVSSQSANDSYYIAYKFNECEDEYNNVYSKDYTDDEILDIILDEANESLKLDIRESLITQEITEYKINDTLEVAMEDVTVEIYDEIVEISYAADHEDYSKTIGKADSKNTIATVKYNDKEYNFNIVADSEDENSFINIETNAPYSIYDVLEKQYGQTTAIDILSTKIVKDTKAYKDALEDTDTYYETIENILFNFAYEQYSSSGYPSSLGKYNFLMLYFHSADIDEIVKDFYCVQTAASKLLTDYSSDDLISFFNKYSTIAYDKFFSLSGQRLVVYFDYNDDGEADEVEDWKEKLVTFDGTENVALETVARELIYEIYAELNADSTAHTTKLGNLVSEISSCAKVPFNENPILAENQWAKYRYVGLSVKIEDFAVTNTSTDVDFNLKQRLYDYTIDEKYQYFINDTTPTVYIENLTDDCLTIGNSEIVETNDGYNLILVTEGTSSSSAKLDKDDYSDDLFENIVVKYNDNYHTITDIYNDDDKLSTNQIKLFVLEYVSKGASTLSPEVINSALTTYLQPVISRFVNDETQRIILLEFIENRTGEVITFANDADNDNNGLADNFEKLIEINRRVADGYSHVYNDITGTSDSFPDWWKELSAAVEYFLIKEAE